MQDQEQLTDGQQSGKTYPTQPDARGYFYASEENEKNNVKSRVYPTPVDDNGYYFENEEEEGLNIRTKQYENSCLTKTLELRSGKEVIMHELTAKDSEEARQIAGKNEARVLTACIALSAKFDGKSLYTEEILQLKLKDYKKLTIACQALNF